MKRLCDPHRRRDLINRAWLGLATLFIVFGFRELSLQQRQIESEGADRRDQSCRLLERQHKADVDGLRTTYSYLLSLTADQRDEPLNRLIVTQLPQIEGEAKLDRAPNYCDEQGIGLPEPDPKLPKRPQGL